MNRLDNTFKKELYDHRIVPSSSAWERVESGLNTKEEKKGFYWYAAVAAALVILFAFSAIIRWNSSGNETIVPVDQVVEQPAEELPLEVEEPIYKEEIKSPVDHQIAFVSEREESSKSVTAQTIKRKTDILELKLPALTELDSEALALTPRTEDYLLFDMASLQGYYVIHDDDASTEKKIANYTKDQLKNWVNGEPIKLPKPKIKKPKLDVGWNTVEDTVIVEVNGLQVIIQTEDISASMAEIQTKMAAIGKEMSALNKQMADAESDEDRERINAEMEALEAQLEALEAEMDEVIASFEQDLQIQINELEESGLFDDDDDWASWSDEDDDYDSDDWEDWDWNSDNGRRTVGAGDFFIGLNNYVAPDGKFPSTPDDAYALKTWGSWHWGFGGGYKTRIGASGPLHIKYGLEFEWRNYNLEQNNMISKGDSAVMFTSTPGVTYRKNRFNTMQLNVPVMLQLDWSKNRTVENGFNIGVGGYAGVCFWGYSKAVYFDDVGDRRRDFVRSDFYTNNVRYGLMAQIGFGWISFYARYDMNTVFRENRGPELNNVMFGVVL